MKQKLLLFAALAFIASAFFACGNDSVKKDSAFVTESMTDSVESQIGGLNYWSAITMDFPTKGNPQLVRSIREWMAEQAESSDSVDFASAADLMKDFNRGNEKFFKKTFEEDYIGEGAMPEDLNINFSRSMEFEKIFENDHFVTYLSKEDIYLGGAHGSYFVKGVTFRKSDGRRFGYDMLKGSSRASIATLITKNLEVYFEAKNIEELKENLMLDEYESQVPLPHNPPFLKGDTLMFVYQQYEIAAYAYGLPEAAIPLKDLKGLLSPSFAKEIQP